MKIDEISFFTPCWNEEAHLESTVEKAWKVLKKIAKRYEIIIINDGSQDRTGEIADRLAKRNKYVRVIHHAKNLGYGWALKSGFYKARYKWITFIDADGQFDFSEIAKFLKTQKKTGADLVIGYYLKRQVPFYRIWASKLLWELPVFLLFGLKVRDVDCGFKLIKKEAIDRISKLEAGRGPFISSELLIKAKKAGFRIAEVGVHHYPRKVGKASGINLNVIVNGYFDLLRLRKKLKKSDKDLNKDHPSTRSPKGRMILEEKPELFLLIAILLLASFLRLYRIADYMTFLGDEGRDVLVVKRMIIDNKWTLLGPTASVGGFFLGPIYYYFMIPFLWVFRLDPVGPAVMVALFGIATVFLVYKVGKDFFDFKVGLLAAGLYAISPLVIAYSRSSWNPNLMPFFSLMIIWVSWKAATRKKEELKLWGLLGFLLGIAIQLHYLAVFLAVVAAAFLLLFFRQFKYLKFYFFTVGGFILGWLPFLLFELRHQFPNFRTLYQFILHGEETEFVVDRLWPIISDVTLRLFSRLVTNNQIIVARFLLFLSLAILAFSLLRLKRRAKAIKTYSLLGLWLVIGIGLFGFYQKGIYDYYFGFIFPLPFLLTALALTKIARVNKACCYIVILLYCYIVILNLRGVPFRYPPNRQLAQTKKIAEIILRETADKPFNFALITGQNSDHAYRYFLEVWGNSPVAIENPQIDPERKTVTDQLLVVCELADCHPLGHPLWEIAGFGRAEIVGRWSAPGGITVMKLIHYTGEQ